MSARSEDPTILAFADGYLPGYKHGGPLRSLANLFNALHGSYRFLLMTRDRDYGDTRAYPDVQPDSWQNRGEVEVYYSSPGLLSLLRLAKVIRSSEADLFYLNSLFSPVFTIWPLLLRRLGVLGGQPVVLAPRGELSPGAIKLKGLKKRIYLVVARRLRIYEDVVWQASSDYEKADIQRWFGEDAEIRIAPDLATPTIQNAAGYRAAPKVPTALKAIFLSRIVPKKNLAGAIALLEGVKGEVEFNVYGPAEDDDYLRECKRISESLPPNVRVTYHGPVPFEEVQEALEAHHLFFFPTLGENYGHVIFEALAAGCPVLVSDTTPWRDFEEKGVGWVVPLDRPDVFRAVLQECVDMDEARHAQLSNQARKYAAETATDPEVRLQNMNLFEAVIESSDAAREESAARVDRLPDGRKL